MHYLLLNITKNVYIYWSTEHDTFVGRAIYGFSDPIKYCVSVLRTVLRLFHFVDHTFYMKIALFICKTGAHAREIPI